MLTEIKGLYAITPECADTAQLLDKVKQVLRGGAALVQYRSKSDDVALKHEQATELLKLCQAYYVPLIINDDMRLAALIEADGVHLGETDPALKEARINLGPNSIIGVSCYQDLERAAHLAAQGANYVAFGSFYPSPTKPQAKPCPLSLLTAAHAKISVPIIAIGGITPDNAPELIRAGADAVAVISALFDAPDIELTATLFTSFFALKH